MRWSKIFIIIATLVSSTSCKKTEEKVAAQKEIKLPEMENTFPFSEADKVELISFYYGDYRPEGFNYEIKEGKVPFDEKIIKERVLLDKKQQWELFRILNTDTCPKEFAVADCYMPEHRITFYKEGKTIGFLEVCLQCVGSRISKGFTTVRLCGQKMDELKQFFMLSGIKHFSEM